ncbi:MAG: hypothetical protein LRY69_06305 [Gammaproteobacteria bacterium]|nr:hypothetical protein [Gammaproteobacteria bacterium]
MWNSVVWLIEDSSVSRKLLDREINSRGLLDKSRLVVSKNYDEALVHLASFDQNNLLYVVLDYDLGDQHKRNGVDLFGLIKDKFPSAYIVNYSSTPNAFQKQVTDRFSSNFNAVASHEEISITEAEPCSSKVPALAIEKIKSELRSSPRDSHVNTTARVRSNSGYSMQNSITSRRPKDNDQKSVSVCCSSWPSLYWFTSSQKKTPRECM